MIILRYVKIELTL